MRTIHCFTVRFYGTHVWKASGDIEKQQRMANGAANRGSLFNVRRAVLHSLRHFLFMCSNVLYSRFAIQCLPRRSPFAAPFSIRHAVRHSPRHSPRRFLFIFPQFSLFKLRYLMFAAPLAIHSSPFANRRAIRHSPFAAAFQCHLTLSIRTFI